jgi:hypothetical protein
MHAAEAKMKALAKAQSIETLCQSFELTNNRIGEAGVATARGVIMDELEARNPEVFIAWMETSDVSLMDMPSAFFC